MMGIISSCENIRLALYPHLVPVALAMFLAVYAVIKTKHSRLSIAFLFFTGSFSLWLLGDLVLWTSAPYSLIYFSWSLLDFINLVFFVFGAYFFALIAKDRIFLVERIFYIALCVPAFIITALGMSVADFNQPVCEVMNNAFLTEYKLFAEAAVVLLMFITLVRNWKLATGVKQARMLSVFLAILLFFAVFAGTDYLSSITGIYEIGLYGLFVLPVFLIVIVFSMTNLGVFEFRLLGTQILSYALIIMTGSQLLFIQDSTQTTLSVVTLAISIFFGVLLLQNAKKEEQVRVKVEKLAKELDAANSQQVILIHFITHQIKGFVAKSRNIFSLMIEGDYGVLPEPARVAAQTGFESDTKGAQTIAEILNAANIKSGKVTYAMEAFDLKATIESIVNDLKPLAEAKGLVLITNLVPVTYTGDKAQLINALKNLIDNSIKYTQKGTVGVTLAQTDGKVRFEIVDTGVGIDADDMKNLFTEGGRGKNSQKINVESTGFGLYIVKNIIEAHKGTVRAESEGTGHGSHFIVELPT